MSTENSEVFPFKWGAFGEGFTWVRARKNIADGVLLPAYDLPESFLLPDPVAPPRAVRMYTDLEERLALYRIFANVEPTKEAVIAFANKYGWLGEPIDIRYPERTNDAQEEGIQSGETWQLWMGEILQMRAALRLWRLLQEEDWKGLTQVIKWRKEGIEYEYDEGRLGSGFRWIVSWGCPGDQEREKALQWLRDTKEKSAAVAKVATPAWYALQDIINERLVRRLSPRLRVEPHKETFRARLQFVPSSLIGALWLNFAQTIEGKLNYRQCSHCGKPFVLVPGRARTNRQYCSDTCRTLAYRQRKKASQKNPPRRGRPKGTVKAV